MKVYKIDFDVNNYQSLQAEDSDAADASLTFDCSPKLEQWVPPPVFSMYPALEVPDFWRIEGGGLVASPSAFDVVETQFEMAGEVLPLPYKGHDFMLLNVTECLDCLDQEKSEWMVSGGHRLFLKRYAFHPDRFSESSIFKIADIRRGSMYCLERDSDPEMEFKAAVEANSLKGLKFVLLWEG